MNHLILEGKNFEIYLQSNILHLKKYIYTHTHTEKTQGVKELVYQSTAAYESTIKTMHPTRPGM